MNAKNVFSSKPKGFGSQPKDLPLTKRYGKIGIAAVVAAISLPSPAGGEGKRAWHRRFNPIARSLAPSAALCF